MAKRERKVFVTVKGETDEPVEGWLSPRGILRVVDVTVVGENHWVGPVQKPDSTGRSWWTRQGNWSNAVEVWLEDADGEPITAFAEAPVGHWMRAPGGR